MQSYIQRESLIQANSNMAECLFSSVEKQVDDHIHWMACNMQQSAAYVAKK